MIIRIVSKEPTTKIGDSGFSGKAVVIEEDQVFYTCYDVILEAGTSLDIKSIGANMNHIYYCIYGEITFQCSEGTTETPKQDHVIALTGDMQAKVSAAVKTRLFITYTKGKDDGSNPKKAFYIKMEDMIGTDRDVFWGNGQSRRFLRQADGFNVTLTNTTSTPGSVSALEYKNNKETCHHIEGGMTYTWDDDKQSQDFSQADRKMDDATAITMDKNESHKMHSRGCIALCVFYPALKGDESHDLSKTTSSY